MATPTTWMTESSLAMMGGTPPAHQRARVEEFRTSLREIGVVTTPVASGAMVEHAASQIVPARSAFPVTPSALISVGVALFGGIPLPFETACVLASEAP